MIFFHIVNNFNSNDRKRLNSSPSFLHAFASYLSEVHAWEERLGYYSNVYGIIAENLKTLKDTQNSKEV